MSGISRDTGKPITGWEEVVQSINTIFSTPYEQRVERRWFGSRVPKLLGENLNSNTILMLYAAMAESLELFEPRFKLENIESEGTIETLRAGKLSLILHGVYRPNAPGDLTPDYLIPRRKLTVYSSLNGFSTNAV